MEQAKQAQVALSIPITHLQSGDQLQTAMGVYKVIKTTWADNSGQTLVIITLAGTHGRGSFETFRSPEAHVTILA